MRRALAAVGCAVTLALSGLAVASTQADATTSSPAEVVSPVTPLQNAINAKAQRAEDPTAHPEAWNGCNAGYFCATAPIAPVCAGETCSWPNTVENYILHGGTYFYPWGECSPTEYPGCNIGIHGWANNTGYRVWLEQDQNSGNELCISNQTLVPGNYEGTDDDDYWIYLSDNPNPCP
jgi:hypothetical protein